LPTCGTRFFQYDNGWQKVYAEDLSADRKKKIIDALNKPSTNRALKPRKRGRFDRRPREPDHLLSPRQQAPLDEKKSWDPDFAKRKKSRRFSIALARLRVNLGGSTSIDITLPGIDKAYGIGKLRDILK